MSGLPTVPVHAIDAQSDAPQWLIRDLWSAAAVGVIGGLPKSCKSWFGLDLAVSVASATAALDRFEVVAPGPALVYLILVHHLAKRSRRNLGQALRGSSDLHAWTDSACYLARRGDGRLLLTVEHRSAPAPDPVLLRLHGGGHQPLALRLDGHAAAPSSLAEAVRATLQEAAGPLSRTALRQRLRVNNSRLPDRGIPIYQTAGADI